MKILAFFALLALLLPVVTAQSCDPITCASKSGITGSTFCRDNNVYSTYVDYYCASNECVSQAGDKLIERCTSGCSLGTCDICNETACRAKSGFYGSRFCKDNDVREMYRDYSCTFRDGCTFTETERTAETCKDSTCTDGRCGLCDPSVCTSQNGFYENRYCGSDRNVYQPFREYSCSLDRCIYKTKEIKLASCSFGCDSDECTITLCDAGCDSRNGFAGQPYCKDSDVYRKYRSYFCSFNSCEFNETERKVSDCQSCSNGQCAVTKTEKERLFEFDVSLPAGRVEKNVSAFPARIFNGFFFGNEGIRIAANAFVKSVSFDVLGTNGLGELSVFADGRKIASANKTGRYVVSVNKSVNQISISAASSGMVFWVPAVYDLGTTRVSLEEEVSGNAFSFRLAKNELDSMKSAELVAKPANVRVSINGRDVTGNSIDKSFFGIDNEIEFTPLAKESVKGKAAIKIVYED